MSCKIIMFRGIIRLMHVSSYRMKRLGKVYLRYPNTRLGFDSKNYNFHDHVPAQSEYEPRDEDTQMGFFRQRDVNVHNAHMRDEVRM